MIEPMKALTIWQPWASLIAVGSKRYETRSWATSHRGPIAIHAAKKDPLKCALGCGVYGDWGDSVLKALHQGWDPVLYSIEDELEDLQTGCVIATAELVGCYCIASEPKKSLFRDDHSFLFYEDKSSPHSTESLEIVHVQPNASVKFRIGKNEALFGDWTPGRYAWELRNVQMLPKPIPAKGHQRLWNWEGAA